MAGVNIAKNATRNFVIVVIVNTKKNARIVLRIDKNETNKPMP